MKAEFIITLDIGKKPNKGFLKLVDLPAVENFSDLTEDQKKRYAKIYVFEMSGDDIASKLYNAKNELIKIIS